MPRERRALRLLHVTPFFPPAWSGGGMARASFALCRALAARGHEVTVLAPRPDPRSPRAEEIEGVRIRRFPPLVGGLLFPACPGLFAFARRALAEADLVHLHGHRTPMAVAAWRAARAAGRPYVLQPHGTWPRHGQRVAAKRVFDAMAGDALVAGAAALIAVSPAEAAQLPAPARVVGNGVEPVGKPRAEARAGLLFVGNDGVQKRVAALRPLLEALPGTRLEVVVRGGAGLRGALGPVMDRVRVRGILEGDALATAYASAELLVHPAVDEAFGLVPFEAALAGTAAVVAGGHGAGEVFARAGGCVVPPDDPEALRAAVQARLADPALARAEAAAVARFARASLRWDQAAEACERLYREVLCPAPRAAIA